MARYAKGASSVKDSRTVKTCCGIGAALLTALPAVTGGCANQRPVARVPSPPEPYRSVAADHARQQEVRGEAISYLQAMAEHEYAGYRANAIEALQGEPDVCEPIARAGLMDENWGVRFVATMTIGQLQFHDSARLAVELLHDPNPSVRAAAIFALKRNGYEVDITPMSRMLKDPSLRVRSNVALVLGEMGDSSAIMLLRDALTYDDPQSTVGEMRIFQLQVAEALIKLGDESAVSRVRAHLFTRGPAEGEVMALAAAILGRVGARRYLGDLRNIVAMQGVYRNSAEVRLAALTSLSQLGDPPAIELIVEYLGPKYRFDLAGKRMTGIRMQATYALSEVGSPQALPYLAQISDQSRDELVRIQAAAGLIRLIEPAAVPVLTTTLAPNVSHRE